ncbi:F-box family protein with DUF295 [Prunus dulcis]|uniref:F-box family protein with DUF295 n=1 Tax=Prunus dulcis TaxID=3755 RepID=A0A4Y1QTY7_PRUDU|nr:F-box family protein with DUF295 [Prunus dulcis]
MHLHKSAQITLKLPPKCTPEIPSIPLAGLGRHADYPSRKLEKSGTMVNLIRRQVPMTPSRLEPLWQDTGDRSQPDPQSWQVSGTQSQPSRNPGRSRDTKSVEQQILALTVRASPKLVRQKSSALT